MNASGPVPVMLMALQLGPGGTERQLTEIARSLDRSRFEPHVACFLDGPRGDELRKSGVPVLVLPLNKFLSPASIAVALRLRRYLRERRVRLVHTFDYPLTCFGVPVARLARSPVVLSSQRAHRGLHPPIYRRLLRLTDRMVDGVVVNCEAMFRHMVEEERVPPGLIHLCYNGIDAARFSPHGRRATATPAIGAVSLLRPEKGLDILLEAFSKLGREALQLVIVGSGPELPRLQGLAASLGIAGRCRFEPATADVPARLREIDIFVLPSLSEALSNSLMEAMASGCAVVASRVGGNPELVKDQETGLLFDAKDANSLAQSLHRLIEEAAFRDRLGVAASASIRERFSLAASVHRMEEIYSSLLNR
jgi:glycosyltransferase involved in cell wall biosynthesis